MAEEKNLEGLGGWLILVGLGIIFSPIRIIMLILPIYIDMFTNGAWEALTTPGSKVYNPLWVPLIVGEVGVNALLVMAWLLIGFLFFTKKKLFPKVYIGVLLFTLSFIVLDSLAVKAVVPDSNLFDPDTVKELMRTLVAVVIWVPYMLVSKRVKATFIK